MKKLDSPLKIINIFEFTVQKLDISNYIIYIKTVNIIYDELKKSVRKLDIVDLYLRKK